MHIVNKAQASGELEISILVFLYRCALIALVHHKFIPLMALRSLALALSALLVSCGSSEKPPLEVRQFHLREPKPTDNSAAMVRGEQLYRLRGAVTTAERTNRLGHYYTVYWNNLGSGEGDAKIIFDYQQATTASKVLTRSLALPTGLDSGSVEFRITGEAYQQGGRVLAWRARLIQNGKVIAVKRSYLWR